MKKLDHLNEGIQEVQGAISSYSNEASADEEQQSTTVSQVQVMLCLFTSGSQNTLNEWRLYVVIKKKLTDLKLKEHKGEVKHFLIHIHM